MLAHVTAVELLGHSAQGQTLPLILECRPAGGGKERFQVKVAGKRNGLNCRDLTCEMLLTLLAQSAELHVSEPSSVYLTPSVVTDANAKFAMDIGEDVGAGVRWISYLRPFIPSLRSAMSNQALRLLAFDLLVSNGDRTDANPNVAWDGDMLLAFDFEHCLELPGNDYDRMFSVHLELLPNLKASHIFGRLATRDDLETAMEFALDRMLSADCEASAGTLPERWQTPWLHILGYIRYLSANRGVIIDAATADL